MSLQVWLPLNGNLNNQGLNNISVTNNGAIVDNSGKIGKCYSFDGINDYIQIPTMVLDLSRVSICGWIKWGAFNSWSRMFDFQNSASGSTGAIGIANNGTTSTITVFGRTSSGGSLPDTNIGLSAVANTWYHIALTLNNTTAKVYLNGTLSKTFTLNSALGVMTLNNNYLGKSGWSSDEFFQGSMNDFRIYNHCLSSKEVAEIAKGLVLHYPLNNGGFGAPNLCKNCQLPVLSSAAGTSVYSYETTDDEGQCIKYTCTTAGSGGRYFSPFPKSSAVIGNTYTWSLDMKANRTFAITVGHECGGTCSKTLSTQWERYSYTWNFTDNNYQAFILYPYSNAVVGDWIEIRNLKIENGDVATPWIPNSSDALYTAMGLNSAIEFDCSGLGNNGAIVNTPVYYHNSPRYSGCMNFNGTGYIKNDTLNLSCKQETITFWVKIPETITAQHFLFGTFNSWTGNGVGYWRDTGEKSYSGILKSDAENSYGSLSIPALTSDVWYHIAIVYTGTETILYVNGAKYSSITYGKDGSIANPVCYLGNSKYNGCPASETDQSCVSDFRIYATALSADAIKQLYSCPISLDKNGNLYAYEYKEV